MKKIITFGELMLRLSPSGYYRFIQTENYDACFGGAEANVAISLANFGMNVAFVTKLPTHDIGQAAINSLRRYGVNTSDIVRGGNRIGIYYLEKGASQRPSKVIYDRSSSSIATASASDFDWDAIFEDAEWFHFTGITPALSDELADICLTACKKAKEKGITISCDLNYRKKLWTHEKAHQVMDTLCRYVDVCIANEEDAESVFNIKTENTNYTSGTLDYSAYKKVASELVAHFGFEKVAITLRSSISASDNNWAGILYDGKDYFFSKNYPIHLIDRVGGGDSFAAGLIYGSLKKMNMQELIEFAVASSCLKHTIEGDYNQVTVDEVFTLVSGNSSGRIQR